ncbi:MAG: ParA family protein [Betaproteobacteria bacterium HGW-Betaproteobacteria-9]|jgi:chromosome partitioning related protein ParA|nr:MAG: ParA family protein [Betaproteobacteria bacterium HGW-Betaproteobacteria-9]PKO77970.1 MAG: ParA family protein [Betaproteobacteria bacterium HGW-Betaproteobacteria-15]
MLTLSVVATKGGVGKTTLCANIGGLLADMGYRVLLIDADIQPALTRHFQLSYEAPNGLTTMIQRGALADDCISHIRLPPESFRGDDSVLNVRGGLLHLVRSDTQTWDEEREVMRYDSALQDWLSNRLDRLVRIRMAIKNDAVTSKYDVVIIDTQGAVGHLQDAAVNAADMLLIPAKPDIVSAREFISGSLLLIDRHESAGNMGYSIPPMKAVINHYQNTVDSRTITSLIREQFIELRGKVTVMEAMVPAIAAFPKASTAQVPVHWIDPVKAGDIMHRLMWELVPSVEGKFTPNHRGDLPVSQRTENTHEPDTDLTLEA